MAGKKQNILMIVADQLAPHFLPPYGHPVVRAPNIEWIADRGVTFDAHYTSSPLCVPARAGYFTGRLPSRIGVFDSAGDFASSVPTCGHYLRDLGYRTCIAGKCHFIGPDQLHGFEDRTTSDICPAEMLWYSHWQRHGEEILPWYHDFKNVKNSGIAERTTQQDHDFQTAQTGVQWLYDWRRGSDDRPFFMHLSFTHPHDPYATPQRYWDRYDDSDIDMPVTPYQSPEERDAYAAWLYRHYDRGEIAVTDDDIRRSRHAYYGNISLVDDLIGEVLDALRAMRCLDDTIILLTADHGDMLGERGQWYKMSPFERSARVPMIISVPGGPAGRKSTAVTSHPDILPTLVSLATNAAPFDPATPLDGDDMTVLLEGGTDTWPDIAISEFLFEGRTEPGLLLRKGRYKYVRADDSNDLLYDVESDPEESTDLSRDPAYASVLADLKEEVAARYDFDRLVPEIIAAQDRHEFVCRALLKGRQDSWAFQPFTDASRQFYRTTRTWHEQEEADFLRFD